MNKAWSEEKANRITKRVVNIETKDSANTIYMTKDELPAKKIRPQGAKADEEIKFQETKRRWIDYAENGKNKKRPADYMSKTDIDSAPDSRALKFAHENESSEVRKASVTRQAKNREGFTKSGGSLSERRMNRKQTTPRRKCGRG